MEYQISPPLSQIRKDANNPARPQQPKIGEDGNFISFDLTSTPNKFNPNKSRPSNHYRPYKNRQYNQRHSFNKDNFNPQGFSSPITSGGFSQQFHGRNHFKQNFRGNHGYGKQYQNSNNDSQYKRGIYDINSYFHPSMLEDPWKNLNTSVNDSKTTCTDSGSDDNSPEICENENAAE